MWNGAPDQRPQVVRAEDVMALQKLQRWKPQSKNLPSFKALKLEAATLPLAESDYSLRKALRLSVYGMLYGNWLTQRNMLMRYVDL
jgi:hypothetical protein